MALGFQDCCNSSSYFLLTGIPASVQQFEVFYIVTLQGETFCAQYVELPKLNYQIPTYTLVTMTEKTSCSTCDDTNPCPPTQEIFLSQFGTGTIATSTDCYLKTIFPLSISCLSVSPTTNGGTDGKLGLYVVGGVPPYIFYEQGTQLTNSPTIYSSINGTQTNQYIVRQNLPSGNYSITVTDSGGNFFENISCFIEEPPPTQIVTCSSTPTSYSNAWSVNGSVTLTIDSGTPPFTVTRGNSTLSNNQLNGNITENNLAAGSYTYTIVSSPYTSPDSGIVYPGTTVTKTCTVSQGSSSITYPNNLCLSFFLCNQNQPTQKFYLTLTQNGTYNNRPKYNLTSTSQTRIGGASGFNIRWENDTQGWKSVAGTINPNNIQFIDNPNCSISITSFQLNSIYTSGGAVPLTAKPTDFTWSFASNSLAATSVQFAQDACTLVPQVASVSSNSRPFYCPSNPSSPLPQIELQAVGEQPNANLVYYYRRYNAFAVNGGTYLSQNSPIITFTFNPDDPSSLLAVYNYYVFDTVNNLQSEVGSFEITEVCLSSGMASLDPNLCDSCNNADGSTEISIQVNPTTSNSEPYTFFWRKQGVTDYITVPSSEISSSQNGSYFYDIQIGGSIDCNFDHGQNFGPGTYEFYAIDGYGTQSILKTVTINSVNCDPQPVINDAKLIYNCANQTYTLQLEFIGGDFPVQVWLSNNGTNFLYTAILNTLNPSNVYYINDVSENTVAVYVYNTPNQLQSATQPVNPPQQNNSINFTITDPVLTSRLTYNVTSVDTPNSSCSNNRLNPNMVSSWLDFYTLTYSVDGLTEGSQFFDDDVFQGYFELEMSMTNYYGMWNPRWLYRADEARVKNLSWPTLVSSTQPNTVEFTEYFWVGHVSPDFEGYDPPQAELTAFCGPQGNNGNWGPPNQFKTSQGTTVCALSYPTSCAIAGTSTNPSGMIAECLPTGNNNDRQFPQDFPAKLYTISEFNKEQAGTVSWLSNTNQSTTYFSNTEPIWTNYNSFDGARNDNNFGNLLCDITSSDYTTTIDSEGRSSVNVSNLDYKGNYQGYSTTKRIFQFGSLNEPLTIRNGTQGELKFTYKGLFSSGDLNRANSYNSNYGKLFEFKLKFVPTSIPNCLGGGPKTINFNGDNGNVNGEYFYTKSLKLMGGGTYANGSTVAQIYPSNWGNDTM